MTAAVVSEKEQLIRTARLLRSYADALRSFK